MKFKNLEKLLDLDKEILKLNENKEKNFNY